MSSKDTQVLLNEIEGHLLLSAAREEGRRAAARFGARLDWLTDPQREDVERRFEEEYLALARTSWRLPSWPAGVVVGGGGGRTFLIL
ncbi:hypothetical protein [Streptomyces sp. NBC_00474]|uniref:hypothetical protein n=1 Tax=Streptomyces sp. NBC_00474 TaxID=2975754 RepID=UPI002B1DFD19|nr:hypothetical protein [Streptomyces sp. NBC_00474]